MRPGTTHVVTKGSNVWLDDTAHEYLRLPRTEHPREQADWSDDRAGVLQDAVWHPMIDWRIGPFPPHASGDRECGKPSCRVCPGLMITYVNDRGSPDLAWFPNASMEEQ